MNKRDPATDPTEWRFLGEFRGTPFTGPSDQVRQRLYVQKGANSDPLLKTVLESGDQMFLSASAVEKVKHQPLFASLARAYELWHEQREKTKHQTRVQYRHVRRAYEQYLSEAKERMANTVAAFGDLDRGQVLIHQLIDNGRPVKLLTGELFGLGINGAVVLKGRNDLHVTQLPLPDVMALLRLLRRCRCAGPVPPRVPADDIYVERAEKSERYEYWYKRAIAGYTGNSRIHDENDYDVADMLGVDYNEAILLRELFLSNRGKTKKNA